MKTKTIEKKLTLNKETVADLAKDELKSAKGGVMGATFLAGYCPTRVILTTCCG